MTRPDSAICSASTSFAQRLLKNKLADLDQPCSAILCSRDGMALASASDNRESNSRSAALTSALYSLSNSFCAELLDSENREISLSTNKGHAVILSFQASHRVYYLCITASKKTNLAMLIRTTKDTAEQLKTIF